MQACTPLHCCDAPRHHSAAVPREWLASEAEALDFVIPRVALAGVIAFLDGIDVLFLEASSKGLVLDVHGLRSESWEGHRRACGIWRPCYDINGIWRLVQLSDMRMFPREYLHVMDAVEFRTRAELLFFLNQFGKLIPQQFRFRRDYSYHLMKFSDIESLEPVSMLPEPEEPYFLRATCAYDEAYITVSATASDHYLMFTMVYDVHWLMGYLFDHAMGVGPPVLQNASVSLKAIYPFEDSLRLELVGNRTFSCLVERTSEVARLVVGTGELPLLFRATFPEM